MTIQCSLCPRQHPGPQRACPECTVRRRQYQDRYRAKRAASGLCLRCGQNPPLPGLQTCACAQTYNVVRRQTLVQDKQCTTCKAVLPAGDPYLQCVVCRAQAAQDNLVRRTARIASDACLRCGGTSHEGDVWCSTCRGKARADHHRTKVRALAGYGGVCVCCGETDMRFLTLDHINGGGLKHRKEVGHKMHRWVVRKGFPLDFQVLCYNCNCGRAINGGVCPHQDGYPQITGSET